MEAMVTMTSSPRPFILAGIFLLVGLNLLRSQDLSPGFLADSVQTMDEFLTEHIDSLAARWVNPQKPEFLEYARRKAVIRQFQRRGYASILNQCVRMEGLDAIIAFMRTQLQIEYSLNHTPIMTTAGDGRRYVLPIDWNFPVDPWKK